MKRYRLGGVAVIVLCLMLGGAPAAVSGEPSDGGNETLKLLLNDLDKAIGDADQRMVAHPSFLNELRALVERYRSRLRELFFSDDFADGDFTKNPAWKAVSGSFSVTPDKRVRSRVYAERPSSAPAAPATNNRQEQPLGILLKEIIRATEKGGGSTQGTTESAPAKTEDAVLQTSVRFAPAFEVDLTMTSDAYWGAMEIVLMGGNPVQRRYRLIYHASPSRERPIELVRERGGREYIIDSAVRYPVLDDGAPHRIQWTRDINGNMRVLVDGEQVISTVELFYRDEFSAVALVNRGGTYEWGPLRILQAPKPEPKS